MGYSQAEYNRIKGVIEGPAELPGLEEWERSRIEYENSSYFAVGIRRNADIVFGYIMVKPTHPFAYAELEIPISIGSMNSIIKDKHWREFNELIIARNKQNLMLPDEGIIFNIKAVLGIETDARYADLNISSLGFGDFYQFYIHRLKTYREEVIYYQNFPELITQSAILFSEHVHECLPEITIEPLSSYYRRPALE